MACRLEIPAAICAILVLFGPAHSQGPAESATSNGPDVIVSRIEDTANYACVVPGTTPPVPQPCHDPIDGTLIDAIAVGTFACNVGSAPLAWDELTAQHPVIRSGMFRLLHGRFEQIGTSWVKHGFYATNEVANCTGNCSTPFQGGDQLNPGCSDLYTGSLNGAWWDIGPASEINAFSGVNPGPPAGYLGSSSRPVDARLQVHYSDLDPTSNSGAKYFLQGHYVTQDDAAAGNADNNTSYRQALVTYNPSLDTYDVNVTSSTRQQEPAISAWKEFDPAVMQVDARVPGEGLIIVSARATNIDGTFWHYEYAIENLNSDRAGGSFSVPLPQHATVQNIGFHDVDYHSGEPYSRDDWTAIVANNSVTWSTESFNQNQNANALRWSTLYNFRFDLNAQPDTTNVTLSLFKPGAPNSITVQTLGPLLQITDCNQNGADDRCDLDCNSVPNCLPPCGISADCNGNSVPDECDISTGSSGDCNSNAIPDECDILTGTGADCNSNGVPDECDIANCPPGDAICADCNQDGIPDICVGLSDNPILPDVPEVPKSRYVSFTADGLDNQPRAIRVTLTWLHHPDPPNQPQFPAPNFHAAECLHRWVGPPSDCTESEVQHTTFKCAMLQCAPAYVDWATALGTQSLAVTGTEIVPNSTYLVQGIVSGADIFNESAYSTALVVSTARWGDVVPPFQLPSPNAPTQPNIGDVAALVDKFKDTQNAIQKSRAQLQPQLPDPTSLVDIRDIAATVDAFKGYAYPFTIPPSCP